VFGWRCGPVCRKIRSSVSGADRLHRRDAGTWCTGRALSNAHVFGGVDQQQGRQYDVAPDGRFLINTVLDTAAAPITLLQNWHPAARK
jgi:hypothetical protein